MATAGSLIANICRAYGDPQQDYITDTVGLEWLTVAEQRFADEVMDIDEVQDINVTGLLQNYDIATNTIVVTDAMWYKNVTRKLEFVHYQEFDRIQQSYPRSQGTPRVYTVFQRQVIVGPARPIQDSASALASGAAFASALTISLASESITFRTQGYLKNITSGEVIQYTGNASANITGCVRGRDSTTAASIASGDIFREVDLRVRIRRLPVPLTATTQVPDTPSVWHRYLEQYVLYLAWRNRGDKAKAEIAFQEFEGMEKRAREKAARRAWESVVIKDRRNRQNKFDYGW